MNEFSQKHFEAFFASISAWRPAYKRARLHFIGVRTATELSIVAARIYLDVGGNDTIKPHFRAGALEAVQWEIPQDVQSVEDVTHALIGETGLEIESIGHVRLLSDERQEIFIAPPTLLHPEGLNAGNRLAVLSVCGSNFVDWVLQPESDWLLKAADIPYDSVQELCFEYGLGTLRENKALIEIVARNAVQVLAKSRVEGTYAEMGVWMGRGLDREQARLGYRILDNGRVLRRGAVSGAELTWQDEDFAAIGTMHMEVPIGAVVQCIASYAGQAQNVQWRADPSIHQNPRAAVLALIDPRKEILRSFLQPDLPPRGKAADDFESAVAWMLWALGFSTAAFGTNSKTTEAFDTVAVSPNGDFVVVESTLTLLRADSKLSKLAARAARLREMLAASNMKHLHVLPVIVSAMAVEQVKVDIPSAEENGILVLTRENLTNALETELIRYPNADNLFSRGMAHMEERRTARLKASTSETLRS